MIEQIQLGSRQSVGCIFLFNWLQWIDKMGQAWVDREGDLVGCWL